MRITKNVLQLFSDTGEPAVDIGATDALATHPVEAETSKMTWEQVKADPDLNAHLQEMVKTRLKSARHAESSLQLLKPALNILAQSYGMAEDFDPAALVAAISADRRHKRQDLESHFAYLQAQALAFREEVPDFDLEKELENELFLRLTAPDGVSIADAYYTVHRQQLQTAALADTARQISNAIRSGSLRPQENGTVPVGPSITAFDYRSADRSQRELLKKKIRLAAARGEKLYPNDLL